MVLEYSREKDEWESLNNFGFGAYYQGMGDVQLGLFLQTTESKYKEDGYDESYTQKFAGFNITYFF